MILLRRFTSTLLSLSLGNIIAVYCQGTYDCTANNPCTPTNLATGNFYFNGHIPTEYVQCMPWGQCFERTCPPGSVWDQNIWNCNSQGSCTVTQFACLDGSCIDLSLVCDGTPTCPTGFDELGCQGCSAEEFTCPDTSCINTTLVCDGFWHCSDGYDEENCPECTGDEFPCLDGNCIDTALVCNGFWNCINGIDEIGCGCSSRRTMRQCTRDNFMTCWQPMDQYHHDINTVIVPTLDSDQLNEHCQLFDEAIDCFHRIYHSCHRLDRSFLDGIDDGYSWLCDEARDEYLLYRECFADTSLHEEGAFCNNSLADRLEAIDERDDIWYQNERMCQYANDYLDCVQNAVTSFCGADAGSWQRELDTRLLEPLMDQAFCELHDDGAVYYVGPPDQNSDKEKSQDKGWGMKGSLMIASIALLGAMLVAFAVAVVIRKNKVARVESRQARHEAMRRAQVRFIATSHGGSAAYAEPLPQKTGLAAPLAPAYTSGLAPVETGSYPVPSINRRPQSPPPAYGHY